MMQCKRQQTSAGFRELPAIVATEGFKAQMEGDGAECAGNTPEQFAALLRIEVECYSRVVKALGLRLD